MPSNISKQKRTPKKTSKRRQALKRRYRLKKKYSMKRNYDVAQISSRIKRREHICRCSVFVKCFLCPKNLEKISILAQPGDERGTISNPSTWNNDEIEFEPVGGSVVVPPKEPPTATTRRLTNKDRNQPIIGAASFRNPDKGDGPAYLGDYIEICYYGTVHPSRRPIFDQRVGHFRPQLEQGRTNRVILYSGCFNPPHRGHQETLNRAFSCTQDINVIAAIVRPVTNNKKAYADALSLTSAMKERLWTGDKPHDWLWVFCRNRFSKFASDLITATARDGFHLEFVELAGPDYVGIYNAPNQVWYLAHVIVCDAGRKADFVHADGTLVEIANCTSWKSVRLDQKEIHQKGKDTALWLLESLSFTMMGTEAHNGLVSEITSEYVGRTKGVKVCRNKSVPGQWIRYVPGRGNDIVPLSSTKIRRIIARCSPDKLFEILKEKALNPEILIQLIRETAGSKVSEER